MWTRWWLNDETLNKKDNEREWLKVESVSVACFDDIENLVYKKMCVFNFSVKSWVNY